MMLGSDVKEDVCRECGGDGSNCNTVSGLFDTDDLQAGKLRIFTVSVFPSIDCRMIKTG